jgi:hypothetical protein
VRSCTAALVIYRHRDLPANAGIGAEALRGFFRWRSFWSAGGALRCSGREQTFFMSSTYSIASSRAFLQPGQLCRWVRNIRTASDGSRPKMNSSSRSWLGCSVGINSLSIKADSFLCTPARLYSI